MDWPVSVQVNASGIRPLAQLPSLHDTPTTQINDWYHRKFNWHFAKFAAAASFKETESYLSGNYFASVLPGHNDCTGSLRSEHALFIYLKRPHCTN